MSLFILPPGDKYDKRCGEVFLTLNGTIIFHCTLCENKYKGIHEFGVHIIDKHFDPVIGMDEDCISTDGSDFLEEEINGQGEISVVKDFDTILFEDIKHLEDSFEDGQEEETVIISKVYQNDATESCDSIEEEQQQDQIAQNQATQPARHKVHKVLSKTPLFRRKETRDLTLRMVSHKSRPKAQTVADRIRMVNEEAAKCLDVPTFKQPIPRANIPESERKFKCNFCGFGFKDESNLIAHIKRHSGKKNFQCSFCSKMFCTRQEIEEHSRRHTGEKPFVCTFENCSKRYFTRSELSMHIKRHKNERNFKCEVCDRAFFDRSDLKEHFVSHTQERNHECMVCHAKFSRRKALLSHLKLHENKREYECNLCGASFNQKPGLNSHMKSRHKDVCQ